MATIVQRLASRYAAALDRRPLMTKGATAGSIMTAADLAQQRIEQRDSWDWYRTLRLAGFYSLVHTPFVHFWFNKLERVFGAVTPMNNAPRFAAKVLTDQAIGPPLVIGAFCISQPLLNGDGLDGSLAMLRRDWIHVVMACWQVWVPVQVVVMGVVPLKYRILCMNLVSFGWSTFMSKTGGNTAADGPRVNSCEGGSEVSS